MKRYMVVFKRVKAFGPRMPAMFNAPSAAELEKPIQEFIDANTGPGKIVTIDPGAESGKIQYGLEGEFTITPA